MMSTDFGSIVSPQMMAEGGQALPIEDLIRQLLSDPKTRHIGQMLLAKLQGQAAMPQHLARGGLAGMPNFGGLSSVRNMRLGWGPR